MSNASEPISVAILSWEAARTEAYFVRHAVFVIEQHVPAEAELDDHDPLSEHALARNALGQVVGTGRLLPDGHIGRMAVLNEWRGRGVGAAILNALIERARARSFESVHLSAQVQAQGFYRRFGFAPHGPEYLDVGIAHINMSLSLR